MPFFRRDSQKSMPERLHTALELIAAYIIAAAAIFAVSHLGLGSGASTWEILVIATGPPIGLVFGKRVRQDAKQPGDEAPTAQPPQS